VSPLRALLDFRQTSSLFRFGLVSFMPKPCDHAIAIDLCSIGELDIGRGDLRELLASQVGALFGNSMLTGDLEKVPMVPRERFDKRHGSRLLNEITLGWKIASEPAGDWCRYSHKLRIDEC
jgi:hypothetical protein